MAPLPQPIAIPSLRGGLNDTDPAHLLRPDECTMAHNVEFFWSTLGERRWGTQSLDLTGSDLDTTDAIVHLSQWYPTNDVTLPEYWAVGATVGGAAVFAKRYSNAWTVITPETAMTTASPSVYQVVSQDLNGHKFFCYPSAEDRMFVWDGVSLRKTGIDEPAVPTVADEGAGTFNTVRYYRIRFVIEDGTSTVIVRSEPSDSVQFYPSGSGAGARITRSATVDAATHWEIEASQDDAFFYRIATEPVATTFYDDETDVANSVPAIPATVMQPPGYALLSLKAQILNMGGTIDNGSYSDSISFPQRGWVMYDVTGTYVTEATFAAHNPPLAGDVTFASADVAYALEQAAGFGTSYSDIGTLSEAIGTYLLQPAARFLTVDGDRLLLAGHYTDTALQSTVWWTPVSNDPGVGNDERLPLDVNNMLILNNFQGGPITGIISAISGSWYIFKKAGIYKMTRTGDVNRAYVALPLSLTRGAVEGSIFSGMDASGAPCVYFLDPHLGPSMIGPGGIQVMKGLRRSWNRVNQRATVVARGLYYPYKRQAHWWVAFDDSLFPNYKFINQITEQTTDNEGVRGGWTTADGLITEALTVALFTETYTLNDITVIRDRPFIGLDTPDFIQECDNEISTDDNGTPYIATVITGPILTTGLLTNWGLMTAALLGSANADTSVDVSLIRNFGKEETAPYTVSLSPGTTEPYVFRNLDTFFMSESISIQIKFTDHS